jgi:hypothetical protein
LQDVWELLEYEEEGIETDWKRRCEELIREGGGFSMVHNARYGWISLPGGPWSVDERWNC